MSELTVSRVLVEEDAEHVRSIRNMGRRWMTHNTKIVTKEEQRFWLENYQGEENRCWLFRDEQRRPVGFGLIRREGQSERGWHGSLTLAVHRAHWGKGYGTTIYHWLLKNAHVDVVYLDIMLHNVGSMMALEKALTLLSETHTHYAVLREKELQVEVMWRNVGGRTTQ